MLIMTMDVNPNFTPKPHANHLGSSKIQPVSRTHKQMTLEQVHKLTMMMLCTAELDISKSVETSDIDAFLTDAAWSICSTYHTGLKASPGSALFVRDMLLDIPFLVDWN